MVQATERPGTKKITNVREMFVCEVGIAYDAEHRFLEAQQMMWQCCQNNQLKSALETHIRETEQQIRNLEQVFNVLGQQPQRINSETAAGAISDTQKLLLLAADSPKIAELILIEGQLKVEQVEISCYNCLIQAAEQMEQKQIVQLLQQNLQQEEQMLQKLEQMTPHLLQEAKGGESRVGAKSR